MGKLYRAIKFPSMNKLPCDTAVFQPRLHKVQCGVPAAMVDQRRSGMAALLAGPWVASNRIKAAVTQQMARFIGNVTNEAVAG